MLRSTTDVCLSLIAVVITLADYDRVAVVNSTGSVSNPGGLSGVNFSVSNAHTSRSRQKRYISQSDMIAIVDYHNMVRANVFPPAANMEYMVSVN